MNKFAETHDKNKDCETTIKKYLIPALEKIAQPEIWEKSEKRDAFITGLAGGFGGLPEGIYEITIFKTSKITVEPLKGGIPQAVSIVDKRIKEIYTTLERLEKKALLRDTK